MSGRAALLVAVLLGCADSGEGDGSGAGDLPARDARAGTHDALRTEDATGEGSIADAAGAPDADPDAAMVDPDAALVDPDAALVDPDAALVDPDAGIDPDASVVEPDAAVVDPDAAVVDPDAAVLDPDAAGVDPRGAEWCRLQHPLDLALDPGVVELAYGRVYEPGVTDQSDATDPDLFLVGELGVGERGVAVDDPAWRWFRGVPNEGWDAAAANEPNNDEYQAAIPADLPAGEYHLAWRFSADGGGSWTYCDRNRGFEHDGAEDGFSLDDAGTLVVAE